MLVWLKNLIDKRARRKALKKEFRKLAAEVQAGMGGEDIEAQGLRLRSLLEMYERLADEYDPGWQERGVCRLQGIRALRTIRPLLPEVIVAGGGEDLE